MKGKVTIVGGAGRVGSNAAYALQLGLIGEEIALVDMAESAAQGEALDLTHGRGALGGPRTVAGGYGAATGSDVVVVTAGLRRKPEESRLELITRNANLFRQILNSLHEVELADHAVLLVVTNPVDVLTYLAATELGWPPRRTIGLGTALDTLRFRSLLGEELGLDPSRIDAMMLGEHGDSMVPLLSAMRYDANPIQQSPNYSPEAVGRAVERTRGAGAECLRLKGGAGYAVGLAIRQVVEAVLTDSGATLPVATLDESGEYEGVALSRPTRVGRAGWLEYEPLTLSEEEHKGLRASAEVLKETIARLQAGT